MAGRINANGIAAKRHKRLKKRKLILRLLRFFTAIFCLGFCGTGCPLTS